MSRFTYARAHSVEEAVALLSDPNEKSVPLAGGTDLLVNIRKAPPTFTRVVDVRRVPEMRIIEVREAQLVIGAAVSYTELAESALVQRYATCLAQAARTVGGPAIANMGTLGGNIASAAPWADALPPLICLDAHAHLRSVEGARSLPVAELVLAPNQTRLRANELITHFTLPLPAPDVQSVFLKVGHRIAQTLSRANLAAAIGRDATGRIATARLVVGTIVPVAQRFEEVESLLIGQHPSPELFAEAAARAAEGLVRRVGRHWATEYDTRVLKALVVRALRATTAPSPTPEGV